jgi:phosphopantothenate synthetase
MSMSPDQVELSVIRCMLELRTRVEKLEETRWQESVNILRLEDKVKEIEDGIIRISKRLRDVMDKMDYPKGDHEDSK